MQGFISRQAAIDATSEIVFVEYEDGDSRKEERIILQTKAAIRDRIKALPPVYVPNINVGDMISRPLSAGEIAFCIMLAVVDLILLTTDTERGGET